MSRVFIDTSYLIARILPRDRLHARAVELAGALPAGTPFMTTTLVFAEVLAHVSRGGDWIRPRAVEYVRRLAADPRVAVVDLARDLFDEAVALYEARPDKSYSLTDCASMVVCRAHGIEKILSSDRDFEQEGFSILL